MRILGIDVGASGVKAVEIDSAFGRYEIHEYHERRYEPGTDPAAAVQDLILSLPKAPDRVIAAMRAGQTTFRNLQLPTRDKKAIAASVGFELDDDLPFPIENAAYDYSVLSQSGSSTHVHVAATLLKNTETAIAQWRQGGVDPDIVTTEAWAYRTLFNRILGPQTGAQSQEKPVLLVQMGHERTVLYGHWRGFPVVAREIAWGGRDLTQAICQKYGIPVEQAEAAKLDHGFVLPESQRAQATAEQAEFSDAILSAVGELEREIKQAELTCKNVTHEAVHAIYLSGGTALLPGLGKRIEEDLRVPVHALQGLSAVGSSGVTYSEHTDATFALAASLALVAAGPDRAAAVNLRKGQLAKAGQSREFNISALKKPLAAAGVTLLSMFLSLFVQGSVYKSRLKEADAQLERSVRSFFGQVSTSAMRTYVASPSTLRNQVNKDLGKQRELAKLLSPNPRSPLDFLKELSVSVPRDVIVDMTQYQVGASTADPYNPTSEAQASLTFLVSNPQMAERIAASAGGKLAGMQRSKLEETTAADGTGKRYKITLTGKPTEDSYGK